MIISFNAIFLQIFNCDQINGGSCTCDEAGNQSMGGKGMIVRLATCKSTASDNIYTKGLMKLVILIET